MIYISIIYAAQYAAILYHDTTCTFSSVYVGLNVIINRDVGTPTAEQSYSLTCTVILNGITGSPTIEWLSPTNNPIPNSSNVTVENMVMVNDSAYCETLVFSRLHTSHGGQYTCRATLDQASAVASTKLSVQSAYVKLMSSYVHLGYFFFCLFVCLFFIVVIFYSFYSCSTNNLHHTQPHWCSLCWHSPHPHLLH